MVRFLEYFTVGARAAYVRLDDISAIVTDYTASTNSPCSRIYVQSDPACQLQAEGMPGDVLMGRIITR